MRTSLTEPVSSAINAAGGTFEIADLLKRIRGEYREMPGLCLTSSQARRLWSLDENTCDAVLTALTERRVLRRTAIGTYVRGPSC